MINLEFYDYDLEYLDIDILCELYVGETQFIQNLINEISKARKPYIGKTKKPIKGNKDFIKIGNMIAKEFGFYSVNFSVPFDVSMNAFTYPITMNLDKSIVGKKPKFFEDNGLKYDKNTGNLCILIAVTAGVWFNKEITDREVAAAILHEIGHSFVIQSERMIDVIEANRLSQAISMAYFYILKISMIIINPVLLTSLPVDIKNIMCSTNKGKGIINQISKELANNPLFKPFNTISAITEWLLQSFMRLLTEFVALTPINNIGKILSIPLLAFNKIFEPIYRQNYAISRSQEYLSDSFATMYGMGPEISSFLTKIEYSPSASGVRVEKIISSIPIIGALHETLNIPILLLSNSINVHPSTPARINKILEELNKELKNSDLTPKTKEAIKKNIKDLEKIKEDFIKPLDKNKYNAEMVKHLWMSFITNKGDFTNDYEDYYTELEIRDKYVKKII